jgi:hypothetical protein
MNIKCNGPQTPSESEHSQGNVPYSVAAAMISGGVLHLFSTLSWHASYVQVHLRHSAFFDLSTNSRFHPGDFIGTIRK